MNIDIEITVLGGTDKTIRSQLYVSGEIAGELQMSREDFTKIAERLFDGGYHLTKGKPSTTSKSNVDEK